MSIFELLSKQYKPSVNYRRWRESGQSSERHILSISISTPIKETLAQVSITNLIC